MLAKLKLLLGITSQDKDTLLNLILDMASDEAVGYTGLTVDQLDTVILQMAVFNFNRLGTEGLESENYSGVTFNYASDYPDNIKAALDLKAKKARNKLRIEW